MKTTMFALFLLLTNSGVLHAQSDDAPDFILRKGQDTLFCVITELNRSASGMVNSIQYIDRNRTEHTIKGREETEKVIALRIAGCRLELLALKPDNPDGDKRLLEVVIDGKVQALVYNVLTVSTNSTGTRRFLRQTGRTEYFKLPDGTHYMMTKGNTMNVLGPELKKCSAFNSGFKDKITPFNIYDAMRYYNDNCGE
jgi:hypothetical protein